MSQFEPVRFVDVNLEGQFWRERLETVLTRTIPSQHVQLGKHGILESLKLPNPPPPLRFPRNHHDFTVQVFWDSDVGKWIEAASLCAVAPPRRRHRGQDRGDHRRSRKGAGARRLPQLLVPAARAGEPLDQPARQSRALQCSATCSRARIAYFQATGRRRLLDIMERYVEHVRRPSARSRARSAAIAATRKSSSR